MDEVFDEENFVAQIATQTSGGSTGVYLSGAVDFVLWYGKNVEQTKFRPLFSTKELGGDAAEKYTRVRLPNLESRSLSGDERARESQIPEDARVYRQDPPPRLRVPHRAAPAFRRSVSPSFGPRAWLRLRGARVPLIGPQGIFKPAI